MIMNDEVELEVERLMIEVDPMFKQQVENALTKDDQNIHVIAIASVYLNKALQAARAVMGDENTVDWLLAIAEGMYEEEFDPGELEQPTVH